MTAVADPTILSVRAQRIGHVPAIDGLRAIAVLGVLAYHANPAWLPGGLTGVDIFFAISGFVVPASILWRRFDNAIDALGFFYLRRVYRIFPALLVMLFAVSLLAILFFPRSWLGDGIITTSLAAVFGASNFILYSLDGDYFSPRATYNPFLHTWSLAVEEQFYLLFSGLLALTFARRQSARAPLLVWLGLTLLTTGSFLLAFRVSSTAPAYAFYLLPARFWELGIGVLTYLALPFLAPRLRALKPAYLAGLSALAVLGLIASLVIGTAPGQPYPVPAVLPGVLSAAFLMASSVARPDTFVAATLGLRPLQYIGCISYSLYLWHWPVFVLMRWTIGFVSGPQIAAGIVISLGLAVLSYQLIETPLRSFAAKQPRSRRLMLGGALSVSLAIFALVFAANRNGDRLSLSVTADAATWFPYKIDNKLAERCKVDTADDAFSSGRVLLFTPHCSSALGKRRLIVVGDSHALAYTRMLKGFASTTGLQVTLLARPGCAVLFGRDVPQRDCRRFSEAVIHLLDKELGPNDAVFFAALRMAKDDSEADGRPPSPVLSKSQTEAYEADAIDLLSSLLARRAPIIVEAPQPVFARAAFMCADWFNRGNPACDVAGTIDRARFDAERQPLLMAMKNLAAANPEVVIWDPSDLYCGNTVCTSSFDKKPMFFDEDHFSGFANDMMLSRFRTLVLQMLGP